MASIYISAAIQEIPNTLVEGDMFILKVKGDSMLPLIKIDDQVKVVKEKTNNLKCGDLIVYLVGDVYITHRYLIKHENMLVARGDNRIYTDAPFSTDQFIGKVVEINNSNITMNMLTPLWKKNNYILGKLSLATEKFIVQVDDIFKYRNDWTQTPLRYKLGRVISFPYLVIVNIFRILFILRKNIK